MFNKLVGIYLKIFPLRIMRYHLFRIEEFIKLISKKYCFESSKVLDIWAQNSPYKKYFSHTQYFSQDIEQSSDNSIDFVWDINNWLDMIENWSFDFIVCTQVLEHIREPHIAFEEFNRILKPWGMVFLTTHLCFEEHMIPYDYFRFTRYWLKYLGESRWFILNHIEAHWWIFQLIALIFDTLLIKLFIKRDTIWYYLYIIVFTIPIFVFNSICYLLDFLDKNKDMTLNYECIYKKMD